MTKRVLFTSLILFGFVLFGMAEVFFADVSAELEQARSNIISLIEEGNYAEAQVQTQKLITDFSEHKGIVKAVWQIAKEYEKPKKYDKAFQLHQYNVEHFPSDKYAMWSQVEIVYSHIRDANDADADAAYDKLLTTFSQQPTLPKEVYQVAMRYNESRKPDKAFQLHQYNVEHFPDDKYAMWSQVEIVKSYLSDANDTAADAACDKLLTVFSDQPTLPKEIYQLAMKSKEAGKEDRAFQLHQYNVEHSSKDDMYTMWSQVEIVKSHIRDANDAAADAACDKLLGVFYQQPTLPLEICQLADKYDRDDKASQLYQYATAIDNCSTEEEAIWAQAAMIRSYHALGDDAAAEAAVDKLLTDFSDNPLIARVVWEVGRYYHEFEEYDKASQLYQYVIDNWSKTEYAMQAKADMAKLNIALGNEVEVEAALDNLIADFNDNPDLPEAVFTIGEEYYYRATDARADPNSPEAEAKDYYRKAKGVWERIITEPADPNAEVTMDAYYFIAVCLRRMGRYEEAVAYYQKVLDNWPNYKYAYSAQCLIGECYEKLRSSGTIPESEANLLIEQAYQAVIEKYPDCSLVGHSALKLGRVNFEKAQWVEAAYYFELFLEKAPEDQRRVRVLYDLGRAYEQIGKLDLAAEVYNIFIGFADPSDQRIESIKAKLENWKGHRIDN